jgi:neutral ceramidase
MRRGKDMRPVLLILMLLAGITGCRSYETTLIKIQRLEPLPPVATSGSLEAGLSRVDITPPPGFAVAGYSAMAETCTGFRNRLHARVIYLRSAEGDAVALVQADLLSGSRLVHHRVAELIAPFTDVPVSGLMFAGTHTHSAPGNFFDSNFYNDFAASEKGLDSELYRFLSTRIADAVIEAYHNRRPAQIAVGSIALSDVTRNRSLSAFLANFPEGPPEGSNEQADRDETVNPVMTMIRVDFQDDEGHYRPAGAFSSFSVHPTAVPHWNDLYTADVFGYIARELEFDLEKREETPWQKVHAAVNGTHADNSPAYAPGQQGFIEAKRVGLEIGRQAVSLFHSLPTGPCPDFTISSACREVDLYREGTINDVSLCSRPVVGNALTAGAEDGKTPVLGWLPFFHEGWATSRWLFTGSCQGHKRHIGGIFQPLVLKKQDFPHHLFFQVIRVGEVTLLPFPFEVTCQAGRRISRAVAPEADNGRDHTVVISCANGYFGYVTTPEEYSRQHYEGGHTLYGPNTAAFLEQHAAALVAALEKKESPGVPDAWTFDLKTTVYFPEQKPCTGERAEVKKPMFRQAAQNIEPCWAYRWRDVSPGAIDFHQPLIQIQTSHDGVTWKDLAQDGRQVNDEGYDVSVNFLKWVDDRQMGVYEAKWYNPEIPAGAACRFAVMPRQGQDVFYSSAFH